MRISFLVWDGRIGGAERSAITLAGEIRRLGVEASVVIIGSVGVLGRQIREESVPVRALGLRAGHQVLRHPRLLREAVAAQGADVAVVSSVGYLGATLAASGFRGGLVGIEHGVLITIPSLDRRRGALRRADRALGVLTYDAEVAISAYMEALARDTLHVRDLVRIPHGVRLQNPAPRPPSPDRDALTLGYAGRLIPGKGLDVLLRALASAAATRAPRDLRLRVAGDGPARGQLADLADRLGVRERVSFLGWSDDIRGFWESCDLAIAPNDVFTESFCISAAEAMANARPAVVTATGALPELVIDGETGRVVPPGDIDALRDAIVGYAEQPESLAKHATASLSRIQREYSLRRSSERYIELSARHSEPKRQPTTLMQRSLTAYRARDQSPAAAEK